MQGLYKHCRSFAEDFKHNFDNRRTKTVICSLWFIFSPRNFLDRHYSLVSNSIIERHQKVNVQVRKTFNWMPKSLKSYRLRLSADKRPMPTS